MISEKQYSMKMVTMWFLSLSRRGRGIIQIKEADILKKLYNIEILFTDIYVSLLYRI